MPFPEPPRGRVVVFVVAVVAAAGRLADGRSVDGGQVGAGGKTVVLGSSAVREVRRHKTGRRPFLGGVRLVALVRGEVVVDVLWTIFGVAGVDRSLRGWGIVFGSCVVRLWPGSVAPGRGPLERFHDQTQNEKG